VRLPSDYRESTGILMFISVDGCTFLSSCSGFNVSQLGCMCLRVG
jgi:hypothetical protein